MNIKAQVQLQLDKLKPLISKSVTTGFAESLNSTKTNIRIPTRHTSSNLAGDFVFLFKQNCLAIA